MENLQIQKRELSVENIGNLSNQIRKVINSKNILEIEDMRNRIIQNFREDERAFLIIKEEYNHRIRMLNIANKSPHLLDAIKIYL